MSTIRIVLMTMFATVVVFLVAMRSVPVLNAAGILVPHVFQPRTVASAHEVNENFEALADAANEHADRLADLEARFEPSFVLVRGGLGLGNGHPSCRIRTFDSTGSVAAGKTGVVSEGAAITYLPDAALGDQFIVNENGVYAISYSEMIATVANATSSSSSLFAGISVNATDAEALDEVHNLPADRVKTYSTVLKMTNNEQGMHTSLTVPMRAGSVIRAHLGGRGNVDLVNEHVVFCVTKVN